MDEEKRLKVNESNRRCRARKKAKKLGLPVPEAIYNMNRTPEEKQEYKREIFRKWMASKTPEERLEHLNKQRAYNAKRLKERTEEDREKTRQIHRNFYARVSLDPERLEKRRKKNFERNEKIKNTPALLEKTRAIARKRYREKRIENPHFVAQLSLRNLFSIRLNRHLKSKIKKTSSVVDLIGCTMEEFVKYIERQFEPGMTWAPKNFHLDHIKPCSAFDLTDPEQQKQCFHYTNFQPLWPRENQQKHAKLNWKHPEKLVDTDRRLG